MTGPQDPEKHRAMWDDDRDLLLLQTLLEQKSVGKRTDKGWKKEAWTAVVIALNERFPGPRLNRAQVKNRGSTLMKDYKLFHTLRSDPLFGWDEERKLPTASANVWEAYTAVASQKPAGKFRYKPLAHYDLLHQIFHDELGTGELQSPTELSINGAAQSPGGPESGDDFGARVAIPSPIRNRSMPETTTQALELVANAINSARPARAEPPITHLEKALRVLNSLKEEGILTIDEYLEVSSLLMRNERHCIFVCTAPRDVIKPWLERELSTIHSQD